VRETIRTAWIAAETNLNILAGMIRQRTCCPYTDLHDLRRKWPKRAYDALNHPHSCGLTHFDNDIMNEPALAGMDYARFGSLTAMDLP
jgi:hypothetical protein